MQIIVCVKRVPDTETRIRIAAEGTSIDSSGVKYIMSPYDEFAVEAALRIKEATGDGEVLVVSVGEEAASETIRGALAMGADRALLLEGEIGPDGLATAKALASALRDRPADLLLLGVKAADHDQQQVGPMLATLLGRPCATSVAAFEVEEKGVVCRREVEGGTEVVRLPLPAVVTVTKGEYEPRYASLKGIMAAKRKPFDRAEAQVPPSRITVQSMERPPEREAGRIVGEGPEAVPELIRLLREEAKVL